MPSREKRIRETRAATTTHGRAVTLSTVRTSKFQNDFFTRTAKKWNSLPACAFPKQFNIQSFKTNVHKYLISHPINWHGTASYSQVDTGHVVIPKHGNFIIKKNYFQWKVQGQRSYSKLLGCWIYFGN